MTLDGGISWLQWWDGLTGLPCHQLPARSPSHNGHLFALCWRCSGIHLGIAASALWVIGRTRGLARPPSNGAAIVCVLLMLPLLIDGWGQALGLWQTGGNFRFATGWAFGISLPPLCVPLFASPRLDARRSIGGLEEWLILAAGGIAAWSLLRVQSEPLAVLLRVVVNAGQLLLLVALIGAVVIRVLRRSFPCQDRS